VRTAVVPNRPCSGVCFLLLTDPLPKSKTFVRIDGVFYMLEFERQQEKQAELHSMKLRIEKALTNSETRAKVQADFIYTFQKLGLPDAEAQELCNEIFVELLSSRTLDVIENDVLRDFESIKISAGAEKHSLIQVLHEQLKNRAEIIFFQIKEHLKGIKGKVVDYGAGDGQVTQMLKDRSGLDIEGFDVRPYPTPGLTVRMDVFDGSRLPVPDGAYEAAVLTNVLHHEKDNEKILNELDRVVTKRLVILETVPVGKSEQDMEKDKDRTFMNDYLYNRLFHNADVPVPGTFETPNRWKERLHEHGWEYRYQEDLGFDQPTIKDRHYLLVFERKTYATRKI
jgi:ubiquinone/menaquinone biosynthesis C-methylase UbiE